MPSAPRAALVLWLPLLFGVTACGVAAPSAELATDRTIVFERASEHPYIPRVPGTFFSVLAANPAVVEFNEETFFFFRGQDETKADQIGLWKTPTAEADGIRWRTQFPAPVITVSEDPDAPDQSYILDPAVVVKGDSLFVYYTGKTAGASTFSTVSLAISTDGETFDKLATNPVLRDAIAPEIVLHDGVFYLFYQRLHADRYWEVYVATSSDGIHFDTENERKVFGPSQVEGAFDEHSIATVRILHEGDTYVMTYAACRQYLDYPESIGLARSTDLMTWERYPGNPIFERGAPGTWDEGALWFAEVQKMGDRYLMWYEGTGTGLGLVSEAAREASRSAREENYGGYRITSFSQIGLAVFEGNLSDW